MHGSRISAAAAPLVVVLLLAVGPLAGRAHAIDASCVGVLCVPPGPAVTPPPDHPDPAPTTTTTVPPPSSTDARGMLLADLNIERADAGLPPFTERSDIDVIAGGWSVRLADAGALSHDEDYFTPATRQRLGGGALGENVAEAASPNTAHHALMASAPHRANILDPRFTVVGLGAEHRDGSWWVTEDFMQPADPAPGGAAPEPANRGVDTPHSVPPATAHADTARTSSAVPPASSPAKEIAPADLGPAAGMLRPAPMEQPPIPADVPAVTAASAGVRGAGPAAAVVLAAAGWIALAVVRRRRAGLIQELTLP